MMMEAPLRILLVDDEPDFVEMLSLRLEAVGHQVVQADSGRACLDALSRDVFDAVILDVKMPGMDGVETLQHILQKRPALPVIMMSGHGTADVAEAAKRLGAFDYLLKPADFQKLLQRLNDAKNRQNPPPD